MKTHLGGDVGALVARMKPILEKRKMLNVSTPFDLVCYALLEFAVWMAEEVEKELDR